jgi:hypothetical protein
MDLLIQPQNRGLGVEVVDIQSKPVIDFVIIAD